MIDLDMICARTAYDFEEIEGDVEKIAQLMDDRDDLLAYVDALREAAGRVCDVYAGQIQNDDKYGAIDALRALLERQP